MTQTEPQKLKRLSYKDGVEYRFAHRAEPRLRVPLGESIVCETEDSFVGQMYEPHARPTQEFVPQMNRTPVELNPTTGPIYVEGVHAGDLLIVTIERVVPANQGFTCIHPMTGPLARNADWPLFLEPRVFHFEYLSGPSGTTRDGELSALGDRMRFPLRPFVGTIGVSPEHEEQSTVVGQGPWGGNIDCRDVTEGTKIYLNTYHDGGLFFIGDMHAAQGDMEFFGTAAEARGEVQLSFDVVPDKRIPFIRIEKSESIVQLYCYRPLEDAVRSATLHLMEWLRDDYGLSEEEAFLQIEVNPDFRINIYQCVRLDRLAFTVGAELPKRQLPSAGD
jgi:amidase